MMQQLILSERPRKETLIRVLKEGLGRDYNIRFFGVGPYKSIILSRSPLHAVQISYSKQNIIQIEGTYASPFSAFMIWLNTFFGAGLSAFDYPHADWRKLETEVSTFLKDRFINEKQKV
ncbi:hypothetical protein OKW21_000350 [Catalinimonas alkaloidigena]|uniref:hypothetical protein n=1 Tax=Catalinimonas alkaloidigena TaxID=1075417 RepID=UPI0024049961|nr:hypothetical protein [Catalinimonas alkaloidigena]MDF9795087.1 hypothetical protein [Catalinimonas alkaloidigena]